MIALHADPGLLCDEGCHCHTDKGARPEAVGREWHSCQCCGSGSSLVSRSAHLMCRIVVMMMYAAQRARLTFLLQYIWHTVHVLVLMDCLLADGRTPLIPASFPGKLVTTFGADMTPIKRAAQPREVHHPTHVHC